MNRILVSVRLKAEIKAGLKERADKDGVPLSEMINRACEFYLARNGVMRKNPNIIFITNPKKSKKIAPEK